MKIRMSNTKGDATVQSLTVGRSIASATSLVSNVLIFANAQIVKMSMGTLIITITKRKSRKRSK
jgi:hypothetical protein